MGDDSQAFIAAFAGLSKSMLTSITAALSDNSLSEASKGELVKAQHIAGWVVLFFGASQGIGRIDDGRHATLTDTEMIGIRHARSSSPDVCGEGALRRRLVPNGQRGLIPPTDGLAYSLHKTVAARLVRLAGGMGPASLLLQAEADASCGPPCSSREHRYLCLFLVPSTVRPRPLAYKRTSSFCSVVHSVVVKDKTNVNLPLSSASCMRLSTFSFPALMRASHTA